jgi:hypothetical protein
MWVNAQETPDLPGEKHSVVSTRFKMEEIDEKIRTAAQPSCIEEIDGQ